MSVRRLILCAAAASLMAAPVFADGGPEPEPAPPPPPPAEEPAPPPPPPPPPAFERSFYVEGEGGVSFAGDLSYGCCEFEMETGWNAGGALGVHMSPNWDVEVEVFYARMGYGGCATGCGDPDFETSLSGLGTMVNVLYNFDSGWFADPYLGVGLGAIQVRYDGEDQFPAFTGEEWKFGYQAMAGLMIDFSSAFGLFVEYRFHDAVGDATIQGVGNIEYQSHNASAGIQISF